MKRVDVEKLRASIASLLAAIGSGELDAPGETIARYEGALVALDTVLDMGRSNLLDLLAVN
jgi:hypothetical protein